VGRGDRKTKKGKTAIRSYGNARPHKAVTAVTGPVKKTAATKSAAAKPAVKKAAPAAKKAAPAKKPAA
jgi:ribosomal small subunit protein bTHX